MCLVSSVELLFVETLTMAEKDTEHKEPAIPAAVPSLWKVCRQSGGWHVAVSDTK